MTTVNKKITTIGALAIAKYPDKIPVIVNYENIILTTPKQSKQTNQAKCENFLVRNDYTVGNLAVNIRQKIKLNYSEILLISVKDNVLDASEMIADLYDRYQDPVDGCVHFRISKESTL